MRRKSSPIPEWTPSASSSGSRSYGSDCHTRSVSPSRSAIRWKMPGAPSQPSLSWIATTPAARRDRRPSRVASTNSSSLGIAKRARNRQADSSRRTPVGSPAASRSTTPPSTSRSPPASASAAELSQSGVVVLRPEERRGVARDVVERGRGRLRVPLGRAPPGAADPAAVAAAASGRARAPRPGAVTPSRFTSCCDSDQVGKWTCESVKPGSTQRPPRSTTSGLGSAASCVPTPPATCAPAMASARAVGSDGSIVRTTPFSRIICGDTSDELEAT